MSQYIKYFVLCFTILRTVSFEAQTYASSNFTLISLTDPQVSISTQGQKYSGCWGWYQASKNKEYAIVCSHSGTYWLDVTAPATPSVCAYRTGKLSNCTWRETKSYRNYLYVVSDDFGNNTFQIFDMQYLPDSVHKVYDSQALFSRGHTVWVDGDKLYVASVTYTNGFSSMDVYSLANPENPTLIRRLDQDYSFINHVHDMFVRHDTIFTSCGYQGMYIFKLTSANTFTLLNSLTNYPYSGYNHSSALTPDGQTLVFMDEVPASLPIKIANVSNLSNIQINATVNQFSLTTPHNPFMANNQYCFASSYQDGLQLFDISSPSSPSLAVYFDTYPQAGGNNNTWPSGGTYDGNWGAYPYFPSGNILALDRINGAFMLSTHLYEAPLVNSSFELPLSVCVGATIHPINYSSGANTFNWSYTAAGSTIATQSNSNLSFPASGIYTVTLLAANASYTAASSNTILVVASSITAVSSITNVSCASCTNGAISVNVSGGTSPYSYSWQPLGGNSPTLSGVSAGCYTLNIIDAEGCPKSEKICVSFLSGVSSNSLNSTEVKVYPNPAKNYLTIETEGSNFYYKILDPAGRLIEENKSITNHASILLTNFAKGIYFIEITTNTNKLQQKIIIE